jgi:hypothetical protein
MALVGEMETDTVAGITATMALLEAVDWAALCAVTVTELGGTAAGAVYIPDEEIVPKVVFPPVVPFTNQFTVVLLVPEIVALNGWDCPT